ncbi:MAG: hypothetical protein RR316_02335 [Clostridia bacterium]
MICEKVLYAVIRVGIGYILKKEEKKRFIKTVSEIIKEVRNAESANKP